MMFESKEINKEKNNWFIIGLLSDFYEFLFNSKWLF